MYFARELTIMSSNACAYVCAAGFGLAGYWLMYTPIEGEGASYITLRGVRHELNGPMGSHMEPFRGFHIFRDRLSATSAPTTYAHVMAIATIIALAKVGHIIGRYVE